MRNYALCVAMAVVAGAFSPVAGAQLTWHDTYEAAITEAKETGKPIFLAFRCVP